MLKLLFVVVLMIGSVTAVLAEPRPYFTEPSLSPDRKEIAFVSGGDIWTVAAIGGVASLLVSHPANEEMLAWFPEGDRILFSSDRGGTWGIWGQRVIDGRPQGEPMLIRPSTGNIWPSTKTRIARSLKAYAAEGN